MSSKVDALQNRFFADANEYLSQGKDIARRLAAAGSEAPASDEVHELFRCVHSIKSEASYQKYEEVGFLAHEREKKLEAIGSGDVPADMEAGAGIEAGLESIAGAIKALENRGDRQSPTISISFNNFERQLLNEARRRGERCYQVVFEIEDEAPMKRARAYLVLSNLEQISTVIRTEPSLTTTGASETGEAEEEHSMYACYLTAPLSAGEIYHALDVDQVTGVRVNELSFPSNGGELSPIVGESVGSQPRDSTAFYRLTGKKLDELTAYADDLRFGLREIGLEAANQDGGKTAGKLDRIAAGLCKELQKLRVAKLAEEVPRFQQLVGDLAERLEKQVRFVTEGDEIAMDRRILSALTDPLSHLVRNAVDHGIETPDTRRAFQKDEIGTVSLFAKEEGDKLKITVSDDGMGIDEETLHRENEQLGGPAEDLFGILSKPGYTTLRQATDLSGRGVGLDLVARRIGEIGGEIRAQSEPGKGIAFEISIPKGPSYARLLFFKFGTELYAIPEQAVADIRRLKKGDLKRDGSGRIFYSKLPAYAGASPAKVSELSAFGSYVLIVSYLSNKACMLAEDVLFEHEVDRELLENAEANPDKTRRMAASFGSERREFCFLPPSLIQPRA